MLFNFQPKVHTEEIFNIRENQVWEAAQLVGKQVFYMKATNIDTDEIFGEVISRDFINTNMYEMWATRDNDTHFMGTEVFGGFGLIPLYSDILYIPVKFFKDIDSSFEPLEGDLIYYGDIEFNALFEITKVGDSTEEYEGDKINGRLFNYKIYLKQYNRADDDFTGFETTSIPEVEGLDDVDLDNLNDDLQLNISNENVKTVEPNNPFGELD